jgi:hypothetical protein
MPKYVKLSLQVYLYGEKKQEVIEKQLMVPELNDSRSSNVSTNSSKITTTENPTPLNWDNKKATLEDFQILKVLGRGSFGKVCLVEHSTTKELYAMKSLKKDVLISQEQIENTLQEKEILSKIKHPFLVSLAYCFQTVDRIYFIMSFMRGGELFEHLRKFRIFDEER